MSRKVEEAILASEMEHYYSKEEILNDVFEYCILWSWLLRDL